MTIAPEFIDDLDFPTPEIEPEPLPTYVGPFRLAGFVDDDFIRVEPIGPEWPYSKAATDKARAVIQEQQARNREADFERMLASQIYDEARRLGSGPYQECWCSPSRAMLFAGTSSALKQVLDDFEPVITRLSKELVVLQPSLR